MCNLCGYLVFRNREGRVRRSITEPYGPALCIDVSLESCTQLYISDALVATCVIYTDKMVNEMVDKIGEGEENGSEDYTEILSVITEEVDAEKLKEAAARRAEKQLELPTSKEQVKGKGKHKKKGI